MKTLDPRFKAHLAQPVTTLATCWRIIRLDGVSFAFTTLDEDLLIDGVLYKSTFGFSRTAITTSSIGQVDNLEAMGYFSDNGITAHDLNNGRFNYASVYLFAVNWADLTMGICRLRRGWFGECTYSPNGSYQAELRGLTQALVQEFGNFFSPLCRADLGDSKCQVPINPSPNPWQPNRGYSLGTMVSPLPLTNPGHETTMFKCTKAGTSWDHEPAWSFDGAVPTNDNDVIWVAQSPFRKIATVIGRDIPPAPWQPRTYYGLDQRVSRLTISSLGDAFSRWHCIKGGTSGDNEPIWSSTDPTNDGNAIWIGMSPANPTWQPDTDYLVGQKVAPAVITSLAQGRSVWICTTPGRSGLTEPVWNYSTTDSTTDNGVVWIGVPLPVPQWQPLTDYNVGDRVGPLRIYSLQQAADVWQCTQAGRSGTAEPAWNSNPTVDDVALWIPAPPDNTRNRFMCTALEYPANELGNTASMAFVQNITANTSIEISDGVHTYSFTVGYDILGSTYFYMGIQVPIAANGMGLDMTFETRRDNYYNVFFTNHSGKQGRISKTGDLAHGITINNFTEAYLDGATITWITGQNTGASMELKTYLPDGQICVLWLAMKYPIMPGDQFMYYPGCDKRRDTCAHKFSNILNFRGEPDVPGMDAVINYPASG